jgi:regulator of sigma E protease
MIVTTIICAIFALVAIIFFHEPGHFIAAKASGVDVLELGIGLPPRLFAFKRGKTVYSLNLIPLGAFAQLLGEDDATIPGGLASKSPKIKSIVGAAGPLANGFLAFILIAISFMIPAEVVTGGEGIKVVKVIAGEPAQQADIRPDDVIASIDGQEVETFEQLQQMIGAKSDQEVNIILHRGGEQVEVSLVPQQGKIGVYLGWVTPYTTEQRYPFSEAIARSGKFFLHFPIMIKDSLPLLIEDPQKALVGPVGIIQMSGEMAEFGLTMLIWFAGIVSLGLGLFNLLPFLPLDGGRIMVAIVEGARNGKIFSPQRLKLAYTVGWVIIIAIFLLVTYNDIVRLISGESLMP